MRTLTWSMGYSLGLLLPMTVVAYSSYLPAVMGFHHVSFVPRGVAVVPPRFGTYLAASSSTSSTRGMGMGTTQSSSSSSSSSSSAGGGGGKGANKKKSSSAAKTGGSGGFSAPSQQAYNVNAALQRLEKRYEELNRVAAKSLQKQQQEDDDQDNPTNNKSPKPSESADDSSSGDAGSDEGLMVAEYIVAARDGKIVADWVPVAQLCVARTRTAAVQSEGASDPAVGAGISLYCRELGHVAGLGARIFTSVPRDKLQYAVESTDSFYKHVYHAAKGGDASKNGNNSDAGMTKAEARQVLELPDAEPGVDQAAEIKRIYRKKSFEWHPDRFVGVERTAEEIQHAADMYARIKMAYDTLSSGVRSSGKSWYESLGGRARTDFVGPLSLLSLAQAKSAMETYQCEYGLTGLDPDLVQGFVARSHSTR